MSHGREYMYWPKCYNIELSIYFTKCRQSLLVPIFQHYQTSASPQVYKSRLFLHWTGCIYGRRLLKINIPFLSLHNTYRSVVEISSHSFVSQSVGRKIFISCPTAMSSYVWCLDMSLISTLVINTCMFILYTPLEKSLLI